MSVTKLGRICIDGLNESAALAFAGGSYLSRSPSSPSFWFYALAIDGNAHTFGPELRALLSDESRGLLELIDVGDFEKASDYCTCCDDAIRYAWHRIDPCYACAFGAHDRCNAPGGCQRHGEIHFPETILDPRVKAAA